MNYLKKMKYQQEHMMTLLALLFTLVMVVSAQASAAVKKKVVMVVSGYGQEQGKKAPGYEFEEFAKAYAVFRANGITVDVASPRGGKVEADEYDPEKSYNAKVLADKAIMAKLGNTLASAQLDATAYDAVFIVGGKGAMFDLPKDKALQALIGDIYQQQGTVAAVCHGPAALVDVKLSDGSYLVANKKVNSFTNKEEKLFGKKWLSKFDFMLEDKLAERGAQFQSSDIMLSHVAVDGRLITGQNPSSTVAVATALVKSLGVTPVAQEQDIEDKTLEQVARFLASDQANAEVVIKHLADNQDDYHLALVGTYGFYYLKTAETDQHFENALSLMTVAQKAINNPMLDMQIAKTQHKLGRKAAAKSTLNQLLATKPDYKPALDMLKTL
ncbi:type 1 glutamine amidotransferase domain-containing protein [Thalassomonas sp. RHCl1]|uniref:type 1 glutamine amidotransferase domain-containing protein n=1 Tax=Thalassomonas sp. RHCl1 TaxID=2995320 RepID=UPI00248C4F65|nr:type 1 glutamine amidotransferase domain-containing protein [Thalassomonas sp. RHCl1]